MKVLKKLEHLSTSPNIIHVKPLKAGNRIAKHKIIEGNGWALYKTDKPIRLESVEVPLPGKGFLETKKVWLLDIEVGERRNGSIRYYKLTVPFPNGNIGFLLDGQEDCIYIRCILLSYEGDTKLLEAFEELKDTLQAIQRLEEEDEKAHTGVMLGDLKHYLSNLIPMYSAREGIYTPPIIDEIKSEMERITRLLGDYVKRTF